MQKKATAAPKKATAKKVVKKVAPKKTTNLAAKKVVSKKTLLVTNNQQSFWVNNGQILNSLRALEQELEAMPKDAFAYHVSKDRNDFAQWVEYVLQDALCAADLRKAKTQAAAKTVVTKHLKSYQL